VVRNNLLSFILIYLLFSASALAQFSPNQTITLFVDGYNPSGVNNTGVVGDDSVNERIAGLATLAGLPTSASYPNAPNQVTSTEYYGNQYPSYYTAEDIQQLDAVTAQWNDGIPRYSLIVAKYIKEVMRRSGARQVNVLGASMGGLVTRYMIEKDLEQLASRGRIARWLTLEGVVRGNWIVSTPGVGEIVPYFDSLPDADLEHMSYEWIKNNINNPNTDADNPLLSRILVGHWTSTDDNEYSRALSIASQKPNDGIQLNRDTYFKTITERSLFQGQHPVHGWSYTTHYSLQDDTGAYFAIKAFIQSKRRARIRITQVEIDDIHEPSWELWNTEGEIVFESRVYSITAETMHQITRPINEMNHRGGNAPFKKCEEDKSYSELDLFVFDNLIPVGESELRLELSARELDFDVFYDVNELDIFNEFDQMDDTVVVVSATREGTYTFDAGDWSGTLEVEIFEYTTPMDIYDLNHDQKIDYNDMFKLSNLWQSPNAAADFDKDGRVNSNDLLEIYHHLVSH
jgi:pimeloyl-ACP methyl ester carboxylesterase